MTGRLVDILRGTAMLLALIAGVWHIAALWFDGLSRDTLFAAGRGGVLLLLALGLMGSGRLALVLVVVFCGAALTDLVAIGRPTVLLSWLEMLLMALSMALLLMPQQNFLQD